MKQNIFRSLMAVTFMATLLLVGCQKDTVTLRIRINDFGGNGKVTMNNRLPVWSMHDQLWVNGDPCTITSSNETNVVSISVPSATTYRAIYPYSAVASINNNNEVVFTLPSVQPYVEDPDNNKQIVKAPMAGYTSSPGSGSNVPMSFNNLGAILAINIQNNFNDASLVITDVVVSSYSRSLRLWGTTEPIDITDPDAYYKCATPDPSDQEDHYTVTLARENGDPLFTLSSNASKPVYIYVPSHGTNNNQYSVTVHALKNGESLEVERHQESTQGGNLGRNQMATVNFTMKEVSAPRGAIAGGVFSVSGTKKVFFATGNLQYRASDNSWRIAKNQWEYIGNGSDFASVNYGDNRYVSSSYARWIDLFSWATSGYHNPSDSYNTRYQPYDYKKSNISMQYNQYGYGPSVGTYTITNNNITYTPSSPNFLTDANANYDWGVYHSNTTTGSGHGILQYDDAVVPSGCTWRTLSYAEWNYLLCERIVNGNTGIGHTFSRVILSGNNDHPSVKGYLVYPDEYMGQISDNSEIASIPPKCVFLPITGLRSANSTNNNASPTLTTTNTGSYWSSSSSTSTDGSEASAKNAVVVTFTHDLTNVSTDAAVSRTPTDRFFGCAVRLVTDVEN